MSEEELYECPKCNSEVKFEQKYCMRCGKRLNWSSIRHEIKETVVPEKDLVPRVKVNLNKKTETKEPELTKEELLGIKTESIPDDFGSGEHLEYTCERCGSQLEFGQDICDGCGEKLVWEGIQR